MWVRERKQKCTDIFLIIKTIIDLLMIIFQRIDFISISVFSNKWLFIFLKYGSKYYYTVHIIFYFFMFLPFSICLFQYCCLLFYQIWINILVHDVHPFSSSSFNTSHIIRHLSFGQKLESITSSYGANPLDSSESIAEEGK